MTRVVSFFPGTSFARFPTHEEEPVSPHQSPDRNGIAPAVVTDGPLATGDKLRPLALAVLTLVLIALCAYLTVPLLPALTWGVALAVIAWPLHVWLAKHFNRPALAAFLTTLLVTGLVAGAGLFLAVNLTREAANVAEQAQGQSADEKVREVTAGVPGASDAVRWMDRTGMSLDTQVRRLVEPYTQDAAGLAQGSLVALLQLAVALFVLYHLLKDRSHLLAALARLLPLTRAECDRVYDGFAGSVYANLYATLATGTINGVGGGLLFWAVGLPSPVLWGAVMFVLSVVPIFGTWLVWLPAAVFLLMTGRWAEGTGVLAWGVTSALVVDNVLHVRIAGEKMRLHQVPTLLAFLGGLAVFGASGMVLGPAILAVTVAVMEVWHRRQQTAGEVVTV